MFQRIVVPLDRSKRAEEALSVAARLARASGGSLLLVRVVLSYREAAWAEGVVALMESPVDVEIARAERDLETVASSEELAGIEIATRVLSGDPARMILSTVKESHADLIVMCSHGYTGAKRWILGSVAQKVARHSAIPVLILRQGVATPVLPLITEEHSPRIMVALDGSALAEAALTPAAALCAALSAPEQGELHLVRILPLSTTFEHGEHDSLVRARTEGTVEAKAYLSTVVERFHKGELAKFNLKLTISVDYDLDIAQRLITIAENEPGEDDEVGCDILAMATHGRSGLARWVMGSVAERVLGATSLPLLIVRPQKEQFIAQDQEEPAKVAYREEASDIYPWGALL
ncbi:MAG TPA: universal stress protein [Ktedonosporobacter sp.]|nr:universal stress protein [Ktedonosporobacter sp.]